MVVTFGALLFVVIYSLVYLDFVRKCVLDWIRPQFGTANTVNVCLANYAVEPEIKDIRVNLVNRAISDLNRGIGAVERQITQAPVVKYEPEGVIAKCRFYITTLYDRLYKNQSKLCNLLLVDKTTNKQHFVKIKYSKPFGCIKCLVIYNSKKGMPFATKVREFVESHCPAILMPTLKTRVDPDTICSRGSYIPEALQAIAGTEPIKRSNSSSIDSFFDHFEVYALQPSIFNSGYLKTGFSLS